MSFWNPPTCPCDSLTKVWIERRLVWLSCQFPSNIFSDRPLALPTGKFFAETYEPSKEGAHALLARICKLMDVPESRVILKFDHEPKKVWFVDENGDYLPYAAGTYTRSWAGYVITLDTNQLYNLSDLIGTIAHELAHVRLLGEGRLRHYGYDNELLTDLTACFLGFAIFLANSPRVWVSQFTKWPGTECPKPEYMTSPMFGYVLGHLAWHQDQPKPDWAKYLGSNVINDFKDATGFLFETEESIFRPPRRWLRMRKRR